MLSISEIYDEFASLLPRVAFVAVDCEFGGISDRSKDAKSLKRYLLNLRNEASVYSILQIGFCLAVYDASDDACPWSLYPYNLYTFPVAEKLLSFSGTTMKWLKVQGFSFTRWIEEGLPYRRLFVDEATSVPDKKRSEADSNGVQKLIEAILSHRTPLVFHNGLLDVMHIFDKFVIELPTRPRDIAELLSRHILDAVYDTKNIARHLHEHCSYEVLKNRDLWSLFNEFERKHNFSTGIRVNATRCHLNYRSASGKMKISKYHEAGFDATVTAMIFTAELALLARADNISLESMLASMSERSGKYGRHLGMVVNCLNIHDPLSTSFFDIRRMVRDA